MFFSERFQISSELLKEYGAVDISLVCDIPLFIDPMLIFNSEKEIYKNLHKSIIRYFHFLYTKAEQGLTMKEVSAWFNFSEVPNNWLGYSLVGNKGLALGKEYAKFLYNWRNIHCLQINAVCTVVNLLQGNISKVFKLCFRAVFSSL